MLLRDFDTVSTRSYEGADLGEMKLGSKKIKLFWAFQQNFGGFLSFEKTGQIFFGSFDLGIRINSIFSFQESAKNSNSVFTDFFRFSKNRIPKIWSLRLISAGRVVVVRLTERSWVRVLLRLILSYFYSPSTSISARFEERLCLPWLLNNNWITTLKTLQV